MADAPPPIGRHRGLLTHRQIRSWYEARTLRSRLSADTYLRQLGLFVERLKLEPDELVAMAKNDPDRLRDLLIKLSATQKGAGLLDSYISKSFGGLKSYLRFRGVEFRGFPDLEPIRGASLTRERVPTPEELQQVLERLSIRGRVIALLMAHAGLRPGTIGTYRGERGLALADLELEGIRKLKFTKIPFAIRVPAGLSKTRRTYTTFGTQQLASALLAYFDERRERGEVLSPKAPVVAAAETRGVAKKSREDARFGRGFLTTKTVTEELRGALRAVTPKEVTWRPYVLRGYCSTRLLIAEGHGRISRDLREAILGHDGGVASRYNVGKPWGEELLREARAAYGRAAEFLETYSQSRVDVTVDFRRALAATTGIPEEQAAEATNEEFLKLLREKLLGSASPGEPVNGNGQAHPQVVVPIREVERLIGEGFEFVAQLGPERVVLRTGGG